MTIYGASDICMNIYRAYIVSMNMYRASNICMNIYGASNICMTILRPFMMYGIHCVVRWISTPALRHKLRIGQT